ncbi:MFS transporter [Streptomyces sp. NPDC051362]|uniref:MFS transporter n=1 Tax=Streptomyces sp. NPDC051362 TaxID=3365651 RepID=UPI003793854C
MATIEPFKIRDFRLYFFAQAISLTGSALSPVALTLGILESTNSASTVGYVLAASVIPTVGFLVFGGVWADRLPRNLVMVATNLICALTYLIMGAMFLTGRFELWVAVVLQVLTGLSLAFYLPCLAGLTAETVPPELLQKANGLLSLVRSASGAMGPLLASLFVMAGTAGAALCIDGVTFVLSAWLLYRMKVKPRPAEATAVTHGFVRELVDGFKEVTARNWVWSSIVTFAFAQFASAVFLVLGPFVLKERGEPAIVWGSAIAALSVGQLIGDFFALRFSPSRPLVAERLVSVLSVPVLLFLAMDVPSWVIVASAVPAGFALTFPDALWCTALQRYLPPNSLSRVTSYDEIGSRGLRPIGYMSAALIASEIGVVSTLTICACGILFSKLGSLAFRDVWGVGHTRAAAPATEAQQADPGLGVSHDAV